MAYYKWIGHAEIVLEDYHRSKRLLHQIELDEIYRAHKADGMPRSYLVRDTVGNVVIRMTTGRANMLRQEIDAVDAVRRGLREKEKDKGKLELLDLMWLERRLPLYAACDLLGIGYRTGSRWKREILQRLARELGWI